MTNSDSAATPAPFASAEEFQFLADSIPQLVWITDATGFHTYFNRRWTDFTGYTLADSVGPDMWNNLLHPDDQQRARQVWGHSLATGEDYEIEYRFKAKDGSYRWFLGAARPRRDAEGRITTWFGTCTDIDDQKRTEQLMRRSEERYALAALATKDVIWDWNLKTNEVNWNPAVYSRLGYRADEVATTAQWWYDHLHPDDAERVVHGIHEVIDSAGSIAWHDEYRFRRADGTYAQMLDRGHISRDETGKSVRMIGAMQDVTKRRAAEAELRRREEEFQTLADNMAQLAWMCRPDGHIYWYNKRWYDYTGTTLEEMEGWGWEKVHHPEHIGRVVEFVQVAWLAGEPFELSFPLRGQDGEYRWFLTRAEPIRDEAGELVRWLGTNTDVTEMRQLQEQLETAYNDLETKVAFRNLDLEHQVRELKQQLEQR